MDSQKLRRSACLLVLLAGLIGLSGCGVPETALANLTGWDLSACEGNFDVCFELFNDNTDQILGGSTALDVLLGP